MTRETPISAFGDSRPPFAISRLKTLDYVIDDDRDVTFPVLPPIGTDH
jgi:hypothetical protein